MTGNGDLKMYGSKYIIDACLHSSVVRNLKNKCRDKEEVDEEGVDDDEVFCFNSIGLFFESVLHIKKD